MFPRDQQYRCEASCLVAEVCVANFGQAAECAVTFKTHITCCNYPVVVFPQNTYHMLQLPGGGVSTKYISHAATTRWWCFHKTHISHAATTRWWCFHKTHIKCCNYQVVVFPQNTYHMLQLPSGGVSTKHIAHEATIRWWCFHKKHI